MPILYILSLEQIVTLVSSTKYVLNYVILRTLTTHRQNFELR